MLLSESRKIPTTSRYNFCLNQPGTLRDNVGYLMKRIARIIDLCYPLIRDLLAYQLGQGCTVMEKR